MLRESLTLTHRWCHPKWGGLANGVPPGHIRASDGHVGDFGAPTLVSNGAAIGAAAGLVFATTSHLGLGSASTKKFAQSPFWPSLQKTIGAWFGVEGSTATMPHEGVQQVIDLLGPPDFAPIGACAPLRGKLRWALYATKVGDPAAPINIGGQRQGNHPSKTKVGPVGHCGGPAGQALAKPHNDLLVYKHLVYACRGNPRVAPCPMASILLLGQRLAMPGQSKWLVWPSGDPSTKAQPFGIGVWHPAHGEVRRYGAYKHPPNVIAAFRKAAAGGARSGGAIASFVLGRQNKAMAEWQFRGLLAGRPCIVLGGNQGSVNCTNSGYANNVHMQAMQMASNLRQAVGGAPMGAYYCQTGNMGIYDKPSRLDSKSIKRVNAKLAALGMPQWEEVEASGDVKGLPQWLGDSWQSQFPMLQDLLTKLGNVAATPGVPPVSLNVEQLQQPVGGAWQGRVVAAAMPIPDSLGPFGPMAYSVEHVHCELPTVAGCEPTWQQLRKRNGRLAQPPGYSMFDAFHGGCGGPTAAILAGIFVKAGAELAPAEIDQFEATTC